MAGLFFVMGFQALEGNGITLKMLFLFRDKELSYSCDPLKRISIISVWIFVALELIGFGAVCFPLRPFLTPLLTLTDICHNPNHRRRGLPHHHRDPHPRAHLDSPQIFQLPGAECT